MPPSFAAALAAPGGLCAALCCALAAGTIGLGVGGLGGCTDAELRCVSGACLAVPPQPGVDDRLRLSGQVCTLNPNTSPYPFRVLLVVDISASTQQSDPTQGRRRAVLEVLQKYKDDPAVAFALVVFSDRAQAVQRTFIRDQGILLAAAERVDDKRGATNYLDTLDLVAKIITEDVATLSEADRHYTQYEVHWLSDGNPEIGPLPLAQHCAQTRQLVAAKMATLMQLPKQLQMFSLRLHTLFLTGAFVSPCIELTRQDRASYGIGPDYLRDMAQAGHGTYQAADSANLHFALTPTLLQRRFAQAAFYLVNHSRRALGAQPLPDSDQDGVADVDEIPLHLNPVVADTGGVGCQDRAAANTVDDAGLCQRVCARPASDGGILATPLGDDDHDGLHNCEELALGLDALGADSDHDRLLDWVELAAGTNPLDPTTFERDSDQDGTNDGQEVMQGTDPLVPEGPDAALAYQYAPLRPLAAADAARSCYDFSIDNVRLVETQATAHSARGENQLCLYLVQHSVDDPAGQASVSRACTQATFIRQPAGAIKSPANGQATFAPDAFVPIVCASQADLQCPAQQP